MRIMAQEGTSQSGRIPAACLVGALAHAFAYPWNGLEETLADMQALSAEDRGAFAGRIDKVLEAANCFKDRTAQQLAYTRLFIGSFKMEAPPYASYYLEEDHTINGKAAVEVAAVYRQFGIELDAKEFAPADHLRYLLSFLYLMAARYEETGESAFADAYVDFRDEYVLSWIGQCRALVDKYAEAPYYPALIALIVDVMQDGQSGRAAV